MKYTRHRQNRCLKKASKKVKKCWVKKKNKKRTFNKCWKSSRKLYKVCMKKKSRRRRKRSRKGGWPDLLHTKKKDDKKEVEHKLLFSYEYKNQLDKYTEGGKYTALTMPQENLFAMYENGMFGEKKDNGGDGKAEEILNNTLIKRYEFEESQKLFSQAEKDRSILKKYKNKGGKRKKTRKKRRKRTRRKNVKLLFGF